MENSPVLPKLRSPWVYPRAGWHCTCRTH